MNFTKYLFLSFLCFSTVLTVQQVQAQKQLGQDIDGEGAYDYLGSAVSISADGKIVAIGAPTHDDGIGKENAGHVRVYQYDAATKKWVQLGQDIDGEAANDRLGGSVSISADGKIVAIGAPLHNVGELRRDVGHVRVYQYDTATKKWVQLGQDINGEGAYDWSGWSVSLSTDGKTVAVGAPNNRGKRGMDEKIGHVRVYQYNTTTKKWVQLGQDIDGEAADDRSGESVSLSADGKTVAIGAPFNKGINGLRSGHVRVYQYTTTGTGNAATKKWVQLGADIDGEAADDRSGRWGAVSLSADGKTVAIGSDSNDAGHVRVYQYTTTGTGTSGIPLNAAQAGTTGTGNAATKKWVQLGADIDGEAADDRSGSSVSLSADGKTVAIGAPSNKGKGAGTPIDTWYGHVRVYKYTTTASGTSGIPLNAAQAGTTGTGNAATKKWIQFGKDIDGEASSDQSGNSISLSADGKTVAIGAFLNGDEDNGHVRVYEVDVSESAISLPDNLAFTDTKAGEMTVKDLTIANTGNLALTVTKITLPAGFTADWQSGTIPAGGKKAVKVTFKPTEAKDYAGTLTVESNATEGRNTISVTGKGILVTAIEPQAVFPGLSVFPNPAEDVLHVKLPNQTLSVSVQLTDINGHQVVYERKAVTGDELSIDVSAYKSGVYVLVVESGSKVTKRKVVISGQ